MKTFLWGMLAIVLIGVTSCVAMYVGAATSVATAPARVITDTRPEDKAKLQPR